MSIRLSFRFGEASTALYNGIPKGIQEQIYECIKKDNSKLDRDIIIAFHGFQVEDRNAFEQLLKYMFKVAPVNISKISVSRKKSTFEFRKHDSYLESLSKGELLIMCGIYNTLNMPHLVISTVRYIGNKFSMNLDDITKECLDKRFESTIYTK
jgi:hypothetical protein